MTATVPVLTPDKVPVATKLRDVLIFQKDKLGGVTFDTTLLRKWLRANKRTITDIDPEGLHTAIRILLHNDIDWRVDVLIKKTGTEIPQSVSLDITFEQWGEAVRQTDALIERLDAALTKAAETL